MKPSYYAVAIFLIVFQSNFYSATRILSSAPDPIFPRTLECNVQPTVTVVQPCESLGSITVTSPVGASFEYSIDGVNYQSSVTFPNLSANSYNVTYRDLSVSCTSPSAFVILENPPTITLTSATATANQAVCTGDAISVISYDIANASGATASGLPMGINASLSGSGFLLAGIATTAGIYHYTVTATGGCFEPTASGTITIMASQAPNFPTLSPICYGGSPVILPMTSPNGISGTWTPQTISNTSSGSYLFTPDSQQCASEQVLFQTVIAPIEIPTVVAPVYYCQNSPGTQLSATAVQGAHLNWYGTNATGGTASSLPTVPSTASIGITTYYVSQAIGSCESPRAPIDVVVTADTGATVNLVCDPGNSTPTLLSFDWSNVPGYQGYEYSYSIDGGPLVFGSQSSPSHYTVQVLPGQSVTFTIESVIGAPCAPSETATCASVLSTGESVKRGFALSPNPVSDILHISDVQPIIEIGVFNLIGQKVFQGGPFSETAQVDMSYFPSGIYFVHVSSKSGASTLRVIKK